MPGDRLVRGGEGSVHLLYGGPAGLQTSDPPDQIWSQASRGVAEDPEPDGFGSALAHGDFNGDLYADLAIAAIYETIGNAGQAGVVHVLFGGEHGLQAASPADQLWHQGSRGVVGALEADDYFGSSLAAADFNGDAFVDLAIGSPKEQVANALRAGGVNILYGSGAGLQAVRPNDQWWHQDSTGMPDAAEEDDSFGFSLATGDFNGDAIADLAVGAPGESLHIHGAGTVTVMYGSDAGLRTDPRMPQVWHQNRPGMSESVEYDDRFGSSLSAGDFDGDGTDDLGIGVLEGVDGAPYAGAVHVLYGSAEGLQAGHPDDQVWSQDVPGVLDRGEYYDSLGSSGAAGDLNGDGAEDLSVGALWETIRPYVAAGAVSVLYASAGGLQVEDPDDQFWHQDVPGVLGDPEQDDQFGRVLSIGDFNGDGNGDLAVGVPRDRVVDNYEGSVHLLYGTEAGLAITAPDAQWWHRDVPSVRGRADLFDMFGSALS